MAKVKKKSNVEVQEISAAEVKPGMLIKLYERIKEVNAQGNEKERVQFFEGTVIAKKGKADNKSVTLRKVSNGIGVEKIFPLALPSIEKIELLKTLKTRRSKLYFTRGRVKKLKEDKTAVVTKKETKKEEKVAA